MELSRESRINLSIVSGKTFIQPSILMENDDFCRLLFKGTSVEELIEFVNENF